MITRKMSLLNLLVLILFTSIAIGHFFPPVGILASPFIIIIMTGLIIFTDNKFKFMIKCLLAYSFIGLNDVGLRLFAGGIHDSEGIGWINALLFAGLIPCIIMLFVGLFRNRNSANWVSISGILIFVFLIYIHLQIFETLGIQLNQRD